MEAAEISYEHNYIKFLPICTSNRHRANLTFIWSIGSGHLVNVSPIFAVLLALFLVSTNPNLYLF